MGHMKRVDRSASHPPVARAAAKSPGCRTIPEKRETFTHRSGDLDLRSDGT